MDNLVIGPGKFVLFVDYTSIEPVPNRLVKKYLNAQSITDDHVLVYPWDNTYISLTNTFSSEFPPIDENHLQTNSNVVLQPISKLLQCYKPQAIFQLIKYFKCNPKIKQLFGWITTKNISEKFIIPYTEYMADTIITLQNDSTLSVVTKKSGGTSITKKLYEYQMKNDSILVNEIQPGQKQFQQQQQQLQNENIIDPESLATFKINLDEEELIARNAMKLPYERNTDTVKEEEFKIIYQPDPDDDIDEEDPDEDLYF